MLSKSGAVPAESGGGRTKSESEMRDEIQESRSNGAVLGRILRSFGSYYVVRTEGAFHPFDAEAEFHSHDEQFVLVRSARISETESNEYVFFRSLPSLDELTLKFLCESAWREGLSRVRPHFSHRNSDVALVVVADKVEDGAFALARRMSFSKSYFFLLKGWSDFRLAVIESSTGRTSSNRRGRDLAASISKQ